MNRTLARLALIICLVALNACSSMDPKPVMPANEWNWASTQPKIQKLTEWSLIGKVSLRSPEESITAAINQWEQTGERFDIVLSSTFFGLGSTRILGSSAIITLTESGEKPLISDNPDGLIEAALGMPLPITLLQHWVKGLPARHSQSNIHIGKLGLPDRIEQAGWTVELSRHQVINGTPLPGRIKLTQGQTRILLAITKWTLQP